MIAIAEAVRRAAGIGWLPTFITDRTEVQEPLTHVMPHLTPAAIPIYAAFQRRQTISPEIRVFVDFCVAALKGENGAWSALK
jgi:DNA-binding transcriptional LysR family regulator